MLILLVLFTPKHYVLQKQVLEMIPKLVTVYDEPFGDSSALPSLLLNKVTKQHVTVALSGDGGDESFWVIIILIG